MERPEGVVGDRGIWRAGGLLRWVTADWIGRAEEDLFRGYSTRDPSEPLTTNPRRILEYGPGDTKVPTPAGVSGNLANLELAEDAIATFAREVGYLGFLDPWSIVAEEQGEGYRFQQRLEHGLGEQFDLWVEAVVCLRVVWRELHGKEQDAEHCEGFFIEATGRSLEFEGRRLHEYRWEILSDLLPKRYVSVLRDGEWAYQRVGHNKGLEPRPERLPHLLPSDSFYIEGPNDSLARDKALAGIIEHYTVDLVGVGFDFRSGSPIQEVYPHNLLGAAWFEMGQDLEGGSDWRRCPYCPPWRAWYRAVRENQTTCGRTRCQGKRFEARRDRSRDLKDAGKGLEEIAATMSEEQGEAVTTAQVEKWIAAAEKRRKGGAR